MTGAAPTTQEHAFDVLESLERYNRWIVDHLRPFAGRRLLEVGAGTGNLTRFFLSCEEVLAVDIDPAFMGEFGRRFGGQPRVKTEVMDVAAATDPLGTRTFDTVLCVNVLEHIAEDEMTLKRFRNHLVPGGKLLLLVPAHAALYGGVDRSAGHVRRYDRKGLATKLVAAGFLVEKLRYFNMLGALGWWVNVRLLRRRYLPQGQSRLLNLLVPALRLEDRIAPPFGLSLIAVATRH
jgi:SAM-dependent methyltransferase